MFKSCRLVFGIAAPLCLTASLVAQSPATIVFNPAKSSLAPMSEPPQASPQSDVLYDTLWITDEQAANAGIGNAIGGERAFPSLGTIDSQLADDFRLDDTYRITKVFVDCQSYFAGDAPDEGFWVQFYANDGVIPVEELYVDATLTQR